MHELTALRIARARRESREAARPSAQSVDGEPPVGAGHLKELSLVSQAMAVYSGNSDTEHLQVMKELWEESNDAFLRSVCSSAGRTNASRRTLPAVAGANAEARAAAERLSKDRLCVARDTRAWAVNAESNEEAVAAFGVSPSQRPCALLRDGRKPATAGGAVHSRHPPPPPQQQPHPPQQPSLQQPAADPPPACGGGGPELDEEQPTKPSSFRLASTMVPKTAEQKGGSNVKGTPNTGGVKRSILGKRAAGGPEEKPAEKATREWSEDWLRIADAEQLERIVPALEATIHRGGADEVKRSDIAGLKFVKSQIEEVLILPQLHPQLFASPLTRPARGLLLFGPPGTGKTMVARWIAAECGATFFSVHASTVMSKWVGEAEKTVKALFQLARERQPSVIFVDEIDSLLNKRKEADNEGSRRVKNEFLTSIEGADTAAEEKVLLIGATNLPWELDPAALRRLQKRLYVPLPCKAARISLLRRQLAKHSKAQGLQDGLSSQDLDAIAGRTDGYSGSDLHALLQEAAMRPVREARTALGNLRKCAATSPAPGGASGSAPAPRNIELTDLEAALQRVTPSFNASEAVHHHQFNEEFGTFRGAEALVDAEDSAYEDEDTAI